MIIRPTVKSMSYESITSTGYSARRTWIDVADDAVPHYGFKYHLDCTKWDNGGATQVFKLMVTHTYYYGLKNSQATSNVLI